MASKESRGHEIAKNNPYCIETDRRKEKSERIVGEMLKQTNENAEVIDHSVQGQAERKENGRLSKLYKLLIIEECNESQAVYGVVQYTKIANKYSVERQSVWEMYKNRDQIGRLF